jgi:hypothetical protein
MLQYQKQNLGIFMIKNRLLLGTFIASALFSSAQAQSTMCYKENWSTPSTIESTPLSGGECKDKKSLQDMKKEGWVVEDIKLGIGQSGMNYTYILKKGSYSNTAANPDNVFLYGTQEEMEERILKQIEIKEKAKIAAKKKRGRRVCKAGRKILYKKLPGMPRCNG